MNDADESLSDGSTFWGQTEADKRNNRAFSLWSLVWAVTFCAVTFVLETFPGTNRLLAWFLAAITIILGVATVRSFLRFLREADEFVRKVQLQGIALGFGAGHLFCISYFILERLGAPEMSIIIAVVPMMFGWAFGSILVARKYR